MSHIQPLRHLQLHMPSTILVLVGSLGSHSKEQLLITNLVLKKGNENEDKKSGTVWRAETGCRTSIGSKTRMVTGNRACAIQSCTEGKGPVYVLRCNWKNLEQLPASTRSGIKYSFIVSDLMSPLLNSSLWASNFHAVIIISCFVLNSFVVCSHWS